MGTRKRTPDQTLNAMDEASLDALVNEIGALPIDEVDRRLDAAGGDAAGTAKRAVAHIAALNERRARLPWQEEARARLAANRATFQAVRSRRPKLSRAELEIRVEALRKEPALASMHTFFRKRTTDAMSDEEMEALLDEVEAARALAGSKDGKDGEGT